MTVLFEGLTHDGEYRVTLSKNARTEIFLEKKAGLDAQGQADWQRVPYQTGSQKNNDAYLYVVMTALASLLVKTS